MIADCTDVNLLVGDMLMTHVEAEERLLSCGFHYPRALHEAAVEFEICGVSFSSPEYGIAFATLIECSIRGVNPTVSLVLATLDALGYPYSDVDAYELGRMLKCTEVISSGIRAWAALVAKQAQSRASAQEHLRKARELMDIHELGAKRTSRRVSPKLAKPLAGRVFA